MSSQTFAINKEKLLKYHDEVSFINFLFYGIIVYFFISIPIWYFWYRDKLRKSIDELSYELRDDRLTLRRIGLDTTIINIPLSQIVSVELAVQNATQKKYDLRNVQVITAATRYDLEGLDEPESAIEQILEAIKISGRV